MEKFSIFISRDLGWVAKEPVQALASAFMRASASSFAHSASNKSQLFVTHCNQEHPNQPSSVSGWVPFMLVWEFPVPLLCREGLDSFSSVLGCGGAFLPACLALAASFLRCCSRFLASDGIAQTFTTTKIKPICGSLAHYNARKTAKWKDDWKKK